MENQTLWDKKLDEADRMTIEGAKNISAARHSGDWENMSIEDKIKTYLGEPTKKTTNEN